MRMGCSVGFEPNTPASAEPLPLHHRGAVYHEASLNFAIGFQPTILWMLLEATQFYDGAWTVGQVEGFDGSRGAPLQSLVLADIEDVSV